MLDYTSDTTVSQRYRNSIILYRELQTIPGRRDTIEFQLELIKVIKELELVRGIVANVNLFSANEKLSEINTNYIPFLNIDYYLAQLYLQNLTNPKSLIAADIDPIEFKLENLKIASHHFIQYVVTLESYKVLSSTQAERLNSFKDLYAPKFEEIISFHNNPTLKRQEKIDNFKLEKELNSKLSIINEFYSRTAVDSEEDSVFAKFDEEVVSKIYIDQLRLFALHSFSTLELITMEIEVLSKRPISPITPLDERPLDDRERDFSRDNDYGYTPNLESAPNRKKGIAELISRQGKILQPFTITTDRQQLKAKVFGTGQVLPSMSVEEYLDYELANGKMMKEEVKDEHADDTDNSDDELEKREWDDWKDDNPKGAGNMGSNIG